ncbi:hypothetical protein FWF74_02580, partial [Candidatus Saccharibacteria bacterium]|nr:hypothetical protein [Candidatus Saccharibacteria bacterium]
MKVNLDRGNKNKYRASRSFSIRSANGEWCKYVSLDECATAERAKFVEDVRQRERVDGGGFFADIGDAGQQDIFDNLVAIPLTDGCNGRCKFCSVCAKPGIRKQMTYNSALWIIQQFTEKSRQTDMQKSQLLLYYDTDPLDWEEVDESGQTVHDFYKLSRMISQKHRTTKTAGVTHVPPHGVKGLLNQMSDEIVVAANSPGINAYPLNVSISEDNDDMIAVFRRDLIEEVIRKLDDPECD